MRRGVYAFLYGALNLGSGRIVLLKRSKFLGVRTGFRVYAFLYAVAATSGCFRLTGVSQG